MPREMPEPSVRSGGSDTRSIMDTDAPSPYFPELETEAPPPVYDWPASETGSLPRGYETWDGPQRYPTQ